ncbi:MAG TPA: hemolysin family protein, partial [Rickettsiales bacterium]|nr:hemolysin family protein [Rickettsiales bacterium]
RPVLRDMLKKGNKNVEDVLKILEDQGRFLSSIQAGITAIGTLAAAYGGANIAHKFGNFLDKIFIFQSYGQNIALVIVVVVLTYISVVLGELIPKRIALRNPEAISILVAKPMLLFAQIFSPIVKLLDLSAEIVMKFFGVFGKNENKFTEAELKAIINEGAETGVIDKSEHEMMQRIFRLDARDVKSIMTHVSEMVAINLDDSIEEMKRKFEEAQHSRYPVVDRSTQKIIGIVQVKNILADFIKFGHIDIKKHLKEVQFISENMNCLKVLEMFKSTSIHLAVIVDEYGAAEGIVTASDIFEAIVGLIPSNYDEQDEVMIQEREDGSWLVDGRAPIEEISIVIGVEELNHTEKYDTIAGFVLDNIDGSPKVGYKFNRFGFTFEVVDMDQRRLDKILIRHVIEKEKIEDLAD